VGVARKDQLWDCVSLETVEGLNGSGKKGPTVEE